MKEPGFSGYGREHNLNIIAMYFKYSVFHMEYVFEHNTSLIQYKAAMEKSTVLPRKNIIKSFSVI